METKNNKIYSYIFNDKLEIENIMKDYTNYVIAIIRNSYNNLTDEDVEEIILDVFVTLWKNQEKLDINKNLSSYIGGITRNLIKKKNRNLKISDNIEDYQEIADLTDIELYYCENEKEKIIRNELEKLKQIDRDIFVLYYYEENSIKEISEILKISQSKVKSKLFRMRKKLKKFLNDRGYDSNER